MFWTALGQNMNQTRPGNTSHNGQIETQDVPNLTHFGSGLGLKADCHLVQAERVPDQDPNRYRRMSCLDWGWVGS